jgi:FkbM family methyltransferase
MKRILYGNLEVEVDDEACENNLWLEEPRHPKTLKFLHGILRRMKAPVMLDIGAGQGRYALLAKFVPDLRALCWEPNPAAYRYLVKNVQLNGLEERVVTFPCGLWKRPGQKTLYVHPQSRRFRSATMGNHPHMAEWDKVKVEVKRLDDFESYWAQTGVNLVKMDVEGAERYVLRGSQRTIKRYKPPLFMEYVNTHLFDYKAEELTDTLKDWGYRQFQKIGDTDLWITT